MNSPFRRCALFALVFALVVSACDSSGTQLEDPDPPADASEGTVSFALKRSENSAVPDSATHAFVRLWNATTDFNLVRYVEIPSSGNRTEVSFSAPPGDSYRAGVIAIERSSIGRNYPLVIGASGDFTVSDDSSTQVDLDVIPWTISIERPDTLKPGLTVAFQATVNGLVSPFWKYELKYGLDRFPSPGGPNRAYDLTPTEDDSSLTFSVDLTVPDVSTEDTLFVRHEFYIEQESDTEGWDTTQESLEPVYLLSPSALIEIPILPENNETGGNVIITFDADGTVTRRVVE